jgi:hypothetical protein
MICQFKMFFLYIYLGAFLVGFALGFGFARHTDIGDDDDD